MNWIYTISQQTPTTAPSNMIKLFRDMLYFSSGFITYKRIVWESVDRLSAELITLQWCKSVWVAFPVSKCNFVRITQEAREDEHECNWHMRRNGNKMRWQGINSRRQTEQTRRSEGRLFVVHTERWGLWLWDRKKLRVGWYQYGFRRFRVSRPEVSLFISEFVIPQVWMSWPSRQWNRSGPQDRGPHEDPFVLIII